MEEKRLFLIKRKLRYGARTGDGGISGITVQVLCKGVKKSEAWYLAASFADHPPVVFEGINEDAAYCKDKGMGLKDKLAQLASEFGDRYDFGIREERRRWWL